MQQLDPKAFWLFFAQSVLGSFFISCCLFFFIVPFILTGGFALFAVKTLFTGTPISTSSATISALPASPVGFGGFLMFLLLFLIFWVVFSFVWAKLTYNNWKYEFTDDAVKIEKGIIWKKYVSIPYERVQNVDIYRGLLARLLGLSDLQIQTAGVSYGRTMISEGRLPGLNPQVAEQMRDDLVKRVKGAKSGV